MESVKPYTAVSEAIVSLDNGGRFYNLRTKAEDGIISQAELGKVGGIFSDRQKMILFLELSISQLSEREKDMIISKLDERLIKDYLKYKPQYLLPSEVNEKGDLSSNVVLTGVPELIDQKWDFNGFFMVPIMTGQVTTFTMIPLIDHYEVYKLRDERTSDTFIIAHSKGAEKLPNEKIVVAGVLKELEKNEKGIKEKFLEVVYCMEKEHS